MRQYLKSIYGIELYVFRTGFLSIVRSLVLYTQKQVYVIQVLLISGIRVELSSILIPLVISQHNLYDIHLLLCIQYQTPDDGQKTCPKHVEFYSKNKFEKLTHLVGFLAGIYQDARSSGCQKHTSNVHIPGVFL
jgi:hypothetical protein